MKRLIPSIFVFLTLTGSLLADDSAAKRYLVATRGHISHERIVRALEEGASSAPAVIREYRHFDAFAAVLTDSQVAALKQRPDIRYLELDPERYLVGAVSSPRLRNARPSAEDSVDGGVSLMAGDAPGDVRNFDHQILPYGVNLVNAPKVWSVGKGAGIKVGIIDTGIDAEHPELSAAYKGGADLVDADTTPEDGVGHGSHVAGTIAAANNSEGVIGVAPEANVYAIRVFDNDGTMYGSALISALDWAITNGMNILNLSLGGPKYSNIEKAAFQRAADAGILIFASSGNNGDEVIQYPAGYASVVAVGAIDSASTLATFSTRGTNLKLTAPGVSVLSSVPRGKSETAVITVGDQLMTGISLAHASRAPISGEYVYCELGKVGQFPGSVSGKIALIQRGEIAFSDKVKNAMAAGATAALIYNKEAGNFSGTLCADDPCTDPTVFPSALSLSMEDGEKLRAMPAGTRVDTRFDDYDVYSGTSMASPHAAAVAALVWSLAPTATAADIRDALITTAHDLGVEGWDSSYGYGMVDAFAAAKRLAPEKFANTPVRRHTIRR